MPSLRASHDLGLKHMHNEALEHSTVHYVMLLNTKSRIDHQTSVSARLVQARGRALVRSRSVPLPRSSYPQTGSDHGAVACSQ
jgi:hypothetical protein